MKNIIVILSFSFFIFGCSPSIISDTVTGAAGKPSLQTPVYQDSQGNIFGYYEYLPTMLNLNGEKKYPIIFYWNGQNAITGDGKKDLPKLLNQGLPQNINEGQHYPAIIISGMLEDWKNNDIAPFVEYILTRYSKYIDNTRIYMTGFSAGGGVTMRYVSEYPELLAAVIPIAPAAQPPSKKGIHEGLKFVSTWFIHNSGDMTVEIWRSNQWHHALKKQGGKHLITRPDEDTHNAWKKAYNDQAVWSWLLKQRKGSTTQ